jgi:predicted GIY-YIG superfamily endonuclease
MKTIWHVYELYNTLGTIEYVGETVNPTDRMYSHKSKKGNFYGRADIEMNIVKQFDNVNEAWEYQCILQKQYGLKTDREKTSEARKGKARSIETKLKISECLKGRTSPNKGNQYSIETKLKISEARKLYWANKKQMK